MSYQPVIGIETHVQLNTKSKLFCGCDNDSSAAKPNQNVCPICSGHPGTLPVLNQQALRLAIRAGLALNGQIAAETKFDRKNYFYPDLPKGYQITQYDQPLVTGGWVELGEHHKKIGITRIHLEEDAGKLVHPPGADYSLLDLNRAGTPLIEIVSEPDITSAEQAKAYVKELYHIMRYAGISDVDLYHGHMRFDVNVSLRKEGEELGVRSEVKNLNSFKAVEAAIAFEIARQTAVLDSGGTVTQETRGWDEDKSETYAQRGKEESHDYRYFPEPDLPPLVLTDEIISLEKKWLHDHKAPSQIRTELSSKGLDKSETEALLQTGLGGVASEAASRAGADSIQRIADWLLSNQTEPNVAQVNPERLAQLSDMVEDKHLSSSAAKQIAPKVIETNRRPQEIAEEMNLMQVSDAMNLDEWAQAAIQQNPNSVADYKAGQERALQFLVGQVMKASQGKANPAMVSAILEKKLKE